MGLGPGATNSGHGPGPGAIDSDLRALRDSNVFVRFVLKNEKKTFAFPKSGDTLTIVTLTITLPNSSDTNV